MIDFINFINELYIREGWRTGHSINETIGNFSNFEIILEIISSSEI